VFFYRHPLLTASGLTNEAFFSYSHFNKRCQIITACFAFFGSLFGCIGLAALLWHFGWLYGFVFTAMTIIGLVGWVFIYFDLERIKRAHSTPPNDTAAPETKQAANTGT
jgi:hypothetical protein